MKPVILFVEDETDLGHVVKQYLEVMDFEIDWFTDGLQALNHFRQNRLKYNILLLDVSLPGMDGFELARNILKINSNTPFLFLTARNEKQDKLLGLKIGADDYITKPFDIDELILRIKNIIKRNQHEPSAQTEVANIIQTEDVTFYEDSLKLTIAGQETTLTPKEADLLIYLFKNSNRILKREEILTTLWGGNDYFLGRSMDVFISRLRKHLSRSKTISINNVYGIGFIFKVTHNAS